ncbi:COQ9 family protein [Tistrella mobilis]|uniref:COQ9 family protein n=1 Tax=Tistrella mobilis TaxID=171437 RepID=UPI003555F2C1
MTADDGHTRDQTGDDDEAGVLPPSDTETGCADAPEAGVPQLLRDRDAVLEQALPDVPFDGWTDDLVRRAGQAAGFDAAATRRLFPRGRIDLIVHFCDYADRRMAAELERIDLPSLPIRSRITTAVLVRLEQNLAHREAIRTALGLLALPQNAALGLKTLYRTVDAMWWAAGDTATDFSFYTKRATLAAVYSSTLAVWLDDKSEGFADTRAFLDRRIADVMRIQKVRGRVEKMLPDPRRFLPGGSRFAGRNSLRMRGR